MSRQIDQRLTKLESRRPGGELSDLSNDQLDARICAIVDGMIALGELDEATEADCRRMSMEQYRDDGAGQTFLEWWPTLRARMLGAP